MVITMTMTTTDEHKRMNFDLRNGDSFTAIEREHATNEITQARRAAGIFREAEALGRDLNLLKDFFRISATKRKEAGGHEVEADTEGPDVDLGSLVGHGHPQLRGGIVEGAEVVAQAGGAANERAGEAKVAEEDLAVLVQHVLQLEVLVDEVAGVHHLGGGQHLVEEAEGAAQRQRCPLAGHYQVQHRLRNPRHGQLDGGEPHFAGDERYHVVGAGEQLRDRRFSLRVRGARHHFDGHWFHGLCSWYGWRDGLEHCP